MRTIPNVQNALMKQEDSKSALVKDISSNIITSASIIGKRNLVPNFTNPVLITICKSKSLSQMTAATLNFNYLEKKTNKKKLQESVLLQQIY